MAADAIESENQIGVDEIKYLYIYFRIVFLSNKKLLTFEKQFCFYLKKSFSNYIFNLRPQNSSSSFFIRERTEEEQS